MDQMASTGSRTAIRPWIFEFFPAPGNPAQTASPDAAAAHFTVYLDLWQRAEALGFEGIFFSEHHFGPGYSPSPHLLIAALAPRTRTLRLGVMGVVLPYYQPWRVVEEIGMLDHLTGGRLEVGTSSGIPQEMALIGLDVAEASARNAEAQAILDAGLRDGVVNHHGKYWQLENLRLVPRPLQQPSPPLWTTVVSTESARRSAQRGSKICTSFHPVQRIRHIFDAFRDEAARRGTAAGPDQLAIRRTISIDENEGAARAASRAAAEALRAVLAHDPRVTQHPLPDAPGPAHNFSVGEEEFIAGTPESVAEQIIAQCRAVGAGHFLANFGRGKSPEALRNNHALFGERVIPLLRKAGSS
jgi:alkanesulfonate monooxygenase SsuD/methylene tetrahydromethanopterin reductase-like flavin-dependent oxidoreductase (luciferase family)